MLKTAPFTVSAKFAGATYVNSVALELLCAGVDPLPELPATLPLDLPRCEPELEVPASGEEVPVEIPEEVGVDVSPEDVPSPGCSLPVSSDEELEEKSSSVVEISLGDSEQHHSIPAVASVTAKTPEKRMRMAHLLRLKTITLFLIYSWGLGYVCKFL